MPRFDVLVSFQLFLAYYILFFIIFYILFYYIYAYCIYFFLSCFPVQTKMFTLPHTTRINMLARKKVSSVFSLDRFLKTHFFRSQVKCVTDMSNVMHQITWCSFCKSERTVVTLHHLRILHHPAHVSHWWIPANSCWGISPLRTPDWLFTRMTSRIL